MPTRITVREPLSDRSGRRRRRSRSRAGGRRIVNEYDVAAADEETGGRHFGHDEGAAGTQRSCFDRRAMLAHYTTSRSHCTHLSTSLTHPSSSSERSAAQMRRRDHHHRHLSSTDIAASPRLVGYVYMAIAGLVCALSAMLFQRNLVPGVELYGGRRVLADGGPELETGWGRRHYYLVPDERRRRRRRRTTTIVDAFVSEWPQDDKHDERWPSSNLDRLLQEGATSGNGGSSNATSNGTAAMPTSGPTVAPSVRPTVPPSASRTPTIAPSRAPSTFIPSTLNPTRMPSPNSTNSSPSASTAPSQSPSTTSGSTITSRPSVESYEGNESGGVHPQEGNGTEAPDRTHYPSPSPSFSPFINLSASPNVTSAPSASFPPSLSSLVPSHSPTPSRGVPDEVVPPPRGGCLIGDCQVGLLPLGSVVEWKVWTAIGFPAGLCFLACAVVAVHFDKMCFPNFWKAIFRDGSPHERNFLIVLVILWGFSLYACTSANSVGSVQPNVFFSSWAGFVSVILTWAMWREGADKPSIVGMVRDHPRLTTFNWLCTALCSAVTTVTVVDLYVAGRVDGTYHGEKLKEFTWRDWLIGLLVPCLTAVWCTLAPLTSHLTTRHGVKRWVRLAWRQVEGIFSLALVGVWSYAIMKFTGVNGLVNSVNNTYLGVWGTFLCSIFTFGTWIRDNRDVVVVPGIVDMRSMRHLAESRHP